MISFRVIDYLDIRYSYGELIGIMIAYLAAVHFLTYLALLRLSKKEKR